MNHVLQSDDVYLPTQLLSHHGFVNTSSIGKTVHVQDCVNAFAGAQATRMFGTTRKNNGVAVFGAESRALS